MENDETILAEGSEIPLIECADRYGFAREPLLAAAGKLLEAQAVLPFSACAVNGEVTREAGLILFEKRTHDRVNDMLMSLPADFRDFLFELNNEDCLGLSLGGSWGYCGMFDDDLFNANQGQEQFDLDFNVHDMSEYPTQDPAELLKLITDRARVLEMDMKSEIFTIDEKGNFLFTPTEGTTREPFIVCCEYKGINFSFALTPKLTDEGDLIIDTTHPREEFDYRGERYLGNFKIPEAVSDPLPLVFDQDEIFVDPDHTSSELFLNTLVFGKQGQLIQILGMRKEMLDKFKDDPFLRVYLTKCLNFGYQGYLWNPLLLDVLKEPIVSKDRQIVFNPTSGELYFRNGPHKNIVAEGEADITSLMMAASLVSILRGSPDNKATAYSTTVAIEWMRDLLSNGESGVPEALLPLLHELQQAEPDLENVNEALNAALIGLNLNLHMFDKAGTEGKVGGANLSGLLKLDMVVNPRYPQVKLIHVLGLITAQLGIVFTEAVAALAMYNKDPSDGSLPLFFAMFVAQLVASYKLDLKLLKKIKPERIMRGDAIPRGYMALPLDDVSEGRVTLDLK